MKIFTWKKSILYSVIITVLLFGFFLTKKENFDDSINERHLNLVKKNLDDAFSNKDFFWPKTISDGEKNYNVVYTFNKKLFDFSKKLLRRHSGDYSSIIVIDNNSGKILAAAGYERKGKNYIPSLPFSSTHPSASLFKIITTAELLENSAVDQNTIFSFNGKGSTLYKYQLKDKSNKWTRRWSLKKAFAYSNNVIFGKAAIRNISGTGIFKKAMDFGFNSNLIDEMSVSKSIFMMPENQYNLAELASGLTRKTLISPVHGALLASVIANNGVMKYPRLVEKIVTDEADGAVWNNLERSKRVIGKNTSVKIKQMMRMAIKRGTARGLFRKLKLKYRTTLDIGGKTGSITGGVPFGKRDWLTLYAKPIDSKEDKGISICIMNINLKKWYVKSTYLAKRIIEYYFDDISPTG